MLIEWVLSDPTPPTDELVEACVFIFRRTFAADGTQTASAY
nr:hypothetical protein [Microbispora cellulosiformans]